MLVRFPVCIITDLRNSKDGQSQYVTLIEGGGAEYQFSARPHDLSFRVTPSPGSSRSWTAWTSARWRRRCAASCGQATATSRAS